MVGSRLAGLSALFTSCPAGVDSTTDAGAAAGAVWGIATAEIFWTGSGTTTGIGATATAGADEGG